MTRPAEKNRTSPENLSWQPGGVSLPVPQGSFLQSHFRVCLMGSHGNSSRKPNRFPKQVTFLPRPVVVRESQTWEAQSGKDVKSSKKLKKIQIQKTHVFEHSVWQNVSFYVFKKWILKAGKLTWQVRHLLTLVPRAHMVEAMASYVRAGTEVLTLTWKAFYKLSPLCMIPCAHTLSLLRFSHHLNVNVNYDWHWLKKS